MVLEWENHTRSCSPNTPAMLLEPGGVGACRAVVRARLWCVPGSGACRGLCWEPGGRAVMLSALPQEPPKASISHHLFLSS